MLKSVLKKICIYFFHYNFIFIIFYFIILILYINIKDITIYKFVEHKCTRARVQGNVNNFL